MSEVPIPEEVAKEAEISPEELLTPNTKPVTEIQKTEMKEGLLGKTDDPKEFIDKFKETVEYGEGLAERKIETITRNPDIDDSSIEEAYLKSDVAKNAFYNFYRDHTKIEYNREKYSSEFNVALSEYFRMTRGNVVKARLQRFDTKEALLYAETQRMVQHDKAAKQLVTDGTMPNFRLARVYTHFLAVSEGLDSYSPDRDAYREKFRGR